MLIIHSLSHQDDIVAARGMLNCAIPDEVTIDGKRRVSGGAVFESLIRSLPIGYAVASTDRSNRLFALGVRPRSTVHGGGEY